MKLSTSAAAALASAGFAVAHSTSSTTITTTMTTTVHEHKSSSCFPVTVVTTVYNTTVITAAATLVATDSTGILNSSNTADSPTGPPTTCSVYTYTTRPTTGVDTAATTASACRCDGTLIAGIQTSSASGTTYDYRVVSGYPVVGTTLPGDVTAVSTGLPGTTVSSGVLSTANGTALSTWSMTPTASIPSEQTGNSASVLKAGVGAVALVGLVAML